MAVTIAGRMM